MRAKIYCEVTCFHCGGLASASGYYQNADTIRQLKKATKNWVNIDGDNLCPDCQRKFKAGGQYEID